MENAPTLSKLSFGRVANKEKSQGLGYLKCRIMRQNTLKINEIYGIINLKSLGA